MAADQKATKRPTDAALWEIYKRGGSRSIERIRAVYDAGCLAGARSPVGEGDGLAERFVAAEKRRLGMEP